MKIFYPKEYFHRVGYKMEEEERKSIAKKNMIVKDRFNEYLEYSVASKSKKDEALTAYSKGSVSQSQTFEPKPHRQQSSQYKRRLIEKINQMDD